MSAIINWTDATKMLNAYQDNTNALKINPPSGCDIIRGYRVDKADVQAIINDSETQGLVIMPAVHLDDVKKPVNEQRFAMLVAGVKTNGELITTSVVDYMLTIPPNVPSNYPYKSTC